jgi:hypothetical protein
LPLEAPPETSPERDAQNDVQMGGASVGILLQEASGTLGAEVVIPAGAGLESLTD